MFDSVTFTYITGIQYHQTKTSEKNAVYLKCKTFHV